ncbi:(deoxy)nucleoside triphosphate pyrophosphohydrolase [Candidatus Endowatersipora endosymbiont of Watersipora subatra]|uniref:(deoxy)nucleoside triphosphate pyrophosphohydrolase n=1 Tax=Candidatus Endowatersipora endosymbiont of Watersipora subatra TaxID=3077946 RepID=UPI003C7DEF21
MASAALIDINGRILLSQRPKGKPMDGLWEFPGGKIKNNEHPKAALIREFQEELGIKTEKTHLKPLRFVCHSYDDFYLLMPVFICHFWWGILESKEGQNIKWVRADNLGDYPMPIANLRLIPLLQNLDLPLRSS